MSNQHPNYFTLAVTATDESLASSAQALAARLGLPLLDSAEVADRDSAQAVLILSASGLALAIRLS